MIDLHERLSEFSYGYGITQEVERLLRGVGLETVPFMPSLLHEKTLGFDVSFRRGGVPLLLQFKLGQSLRRFVRTEGGQQVPSLARPFFPFSVDTAEEDGQYETLLKAESDGAEVYYVAPRFADWVYYVDLFQRGQILQNSILVEPKYIKGALIAQNAADALHRVVYDNDSVFVCSKIQKIEEATREKLVTRALGRTRTNARPLADVMLDIYRGLGERGLVRRRKGAEQSHTVHPEGKYSSELLGERPSDAYAREEREKRLQGFRDIGGSAEASIAATVALELWGLGIQTILVFDRNSRVFD